MYIPCCMEGYLKLNWLKAAPCGRLPVPKDTPPVWGFPLRFPSEGVSPYGCNPSYFVLVWPTCLGFCNGCTFSSIAIAKEIIPSHRILETNKILAHKNFMPTFLLLS